MSFVLIETDWQHDAARLGAVRRQVFIVEQGVPEAMEWDKHDAVSRHWLALDEHNTPIACARLLPDGHLGRMAVLPEWRGRGVGRALLSAVIDTARHHQYTCLKLSAQCHAVRFYRRAGFVVSGAVYPEAGILHQAMELQLTDTQNTANL
ncbi:MAG: GNAT family N-acetyltransferase [Thiobacillus sp.]